MRFISFFLFLPILIFLLIQSACSSRHTGDETQEQKTRLLIFSKTNAYRHECIETGVAAMKEYFDKRNLEIIHSEDSSLFTKTGIGDFDVIMFFNTSGNILDSLQEIALMNYIQDGNGFVGVHAAADTEYDWTWYHGLVGAQFATHAEIQPGVMTKVDTQHLASRHLPVRWTRMDEWYNFKKIPSGVNVLLVADETTYGGGTHGSDHPMAWYHQYDGGRSFYTAMGHTVENYQDTLLLEHILQGVMWASGQQR